MAKKSGDKFLDCLVKALAKAQGYGKTKIAAARDEYVRQTELNQELGHGLNEARSRAMQHVQDALDKTKINKQAKIQASASKIAEFEAGMEEALGIKTAWLKGSPGDKIGHALRTRIEDDQRMKTASHNFVAEAEVAERIMWSMFRDVIDDFSKNAMGIRRGSVSDADMASEVIKPGSTGNQAAAGIAKGIKQSYDYAISEMRLHGVSIERQDGSLPFQPVSAKIKDTDEFIQDMKANIDWTRSGGGRFIRVSERDDWLKAYEKAARTHRWEDMPKQFEPVGGQFAVEFHNDHMIQFKDGNAYAAMNGKYMDGGMMQMNLHRIQKLAHNIGVAKIFGPSPRHMITVFRDMAEKRAADLTPAGSSSKGISKAVRRYNAMTDMVMRKNSMDPESELGHFVESSANLMTTAMLTQASFLSIPGDLATMMAARMSNNEPILRVLGAYLNTMVKIKASRREMLHGGHAASEFTSMSLYNTRYGIGTQYGPSITRFIADKTMRLNLMNRGFDAVRAADNRMRGMSLYEARNQSFASLRERVMLERNGITEADWKRTQTAMAKTVFSPADDIGVFRPIDHFDTLGSELVHKWQRMFYNEGRRTVIENTLEARAMLLANTRPDTLAGAILGSFGKFHGYPVTFFLSMARSVLAADTLGGQMKTVARYGLLSTMAAAMGIQAKNYWQGKEFQDMRDPDFWLKSGMSGGAFSMYGDFITGGMRADTATTIVKGIGGPFAQMIGDGIAATEGSAFQALDIGEHGGKWTMGKAGVGLIDFMRKYMIPETFFVAPILQRDILEPLQERMAPELMARRIKSQRRFAAEAGTAYKKGYGPGETVPFIPRLGS